MDVMEVQIIHSVGCVEMEQEVPVKKLLFHLLHSS